MLRAVPTFLVDAGILAAAPLGGAKLYGGLRGFGVFPVSFGWGGSVALPR